MAFAALALVTLLVTVLAALLDPFPGDLALLEGVQGLRAPTLDRVMLFVTDIGFEWPSFLVVAVASVVLWSLGFRLAAAFALFTLLGDLFGTVVKVVVARPRPPEHFLYLTAARPDFGFPSGHALHAALLYGFLAFIAWRYLKHKSWCIGLCAIFVLLALVTGLSRVYLGAHWPSDVIGGYLIGLVLLMGAIRLYDLAEARLAKKKE